jgi:NAD(P)-dependent dehydrogenase (short-subunit alcohol dehydrogenase family)
VGELRGSVAVVTGGAAGLDRGLAEAFGKGMRLVLADIAAGRLAATLQELSESGVTVDVVTDVSDPEAVFRLRDDLRGLRHGPQGSPSSSSTWTPPV